MSWRENPPHAALRKLPPPVRRKALEIAEALLRERMDEEPAFRIAAAKARAWALQQQRQTEQGSEP